MAIRYGLVDKANRYARQIVAGRIPASRFVQAACRRHLDDLAQSRQRDFRYRFDPAKAEKKLALIQLLPHTKGEWAQRRQHVVLEPWQLFGLACIFGWVHKGSGLRRFRIAYWEVARKSGKSVLAAGVGLGMFVADNEFGAEIYSGATTEKQALEVFLPARLMVKRTPQLQEAAGIEVHARSLSCPSDGSRFEPLIGNPGDGASPSCAIVDEYHEHDTAALFDTMLTGMGARRQPLMFVITTAGDNIEGPCYELRSQVVAMLDGTVPDDELFGWIFTLDEGDDWTDPAVLIKANPNMGVSVYAEYLISQQKAATRYASRQNSFKTKHLNIWVSARSPYFNMQAWQACADPDLTLADFAGQECRMCLDLAQVTDVCARINLFTRRLDGKQHYYCIAPAFYLPEDTIDHGRERKVLERWKRWMNSGHLQPVEGAEIDLGLVRADMLEDAATVAVIEVPHDPWGAWQIAKQLEADGLLPVKIPMQVQYLSPAMKELNAAILGGRFHHDGHPVMGWMMGNVTTRQEANENVFPRKEREDAKIDGPVALMLGIYRALACGPEAASSIYEEGVGV